MVSIISLVTLLVMVGCTVFCYFKGTLYKSFLMIITAVLASTVAFGYFELLAGLLLGRGIDSAIASWSYLIGYLLLFVIAFAVFQALLEKLADKGVQLGLYPERIGRPVCGLVLGLIVAGSLINAAAMAPISGVPYKRFEGASVQPDRLSKPFLSAEDFTAGWASILSKGCFSKGKSMAVFHPDFVTEQFINKVGAASDVSTLSSPGVLQIPPKNAVWRLPENITETGGRALSGESGKSFYVVRAGLRKNAELVSPFTFSQLRVVCKKENAAANPLSGKGINTYPYGYIKTRNSLERVDSLGETLNIEQSVSQGPVKQIDLVYQIPRGYIPVLFAFKKNVVSQLPQPVDFEKVGQLEPYSGTVVVGSDEPAEGEE